MVNLSVFPPTRRAFQDRIEAVEIHPYETTRNWINGKVTRMSPYITHGFTNMPSIMSTLRIKKGLNPQHKLFAELAWREYFAHVWSHLEDGIFDDIRPAITDIVYDPHIPEDVLEARTGIAAIDRSIQELYLHGYVHNHARMWLASYLIHFRKVAWQTGANWMYGHLLDGDLASNHLSWQWVGATFSQKPYLFNAENIKKYAPKEWHCDGSMLDQTYDELEKVARSQSILAPNPLPGLLQETPPELFSEPPRSLLTELGITAVARLSHPTASSITLTHPWDLESESQVAQRVGLVYLPFHRQYPWSLQRWRFVLTRMHELCDEIWIGDDQTGLCKQLAKLGKPIRVQATLNPLYQALLMDILDHTAMDIQEVPRFFQNPDVLCPSFSKFWQQVASKGSFPLP